MASNDENGYSTDNELMPLSQSSIQSACFVSDNEDESAIDNCDIDTTYECKAATSDDYKVFSDPIHGHILLHPFLVKIIDTPQFQRLRNIKQLGVSYFVYPGASHNRFEHCIGTSHLAGKLVRILQRNQSYLKIDDKDILCVEIAGLCHDLGHGPFSHMFDAHFLQRVRPGYDWTHEKGSCMMLDHLIEENKLDLDKYNISEKDITFVKEMIAGPNSVDNGDTWPYKGRGEEKSFLYEIVSNERNKVDVDKWDYFARDCYHLGIRNGFDHNRFMHFVKVLRVEGERLQICARDKESFNLYEMFHTRSMLHRRAYQHRVTNAIDHMLCDAMVLAEPFTKITGKDGTKRKISECVDDPVAYTKLNDSIFDKILNSSYPDLKPARDLLHRILRRQLYQSVGATKPNAAPVKLHDIGANIAACDDSGVLQESDLVVNTTNVNYGMRDKNPIDSFKFFSKVNPKKPYHMRKEDVSAMLPAVFQECEIQVFCTSAEKRELSVECFKKWCRNMKLLPNSVLTPMRRRPARNGITPSKEKRKKLL